jgi:hypothetical protein
MSRKALATAHTNRFGASLSCNGGGKYHRAPLSPIAPPPKISYRHTIF